MEYLDIKFSTYKEMLQNDYDHIAKQLSQLPNLKKLIFKDSHTHSYLNNSADILQMYEKAFEKYPLENCELTLN